MGELKWVRVPLFLILGLQLTVCANGSSILIRAKDTFFLSCQCVIPGQRQCNGTTWVLSSRHSSVELVKLGEVNTDIQTKSNRLSVAANCSLIIRNVSVEDDGYYECQQYISGIKPDDHILVNRCGGDLSVVHMTEQRNTDMVTLTCSVKTRGSCGYKVKWLHDCSAGNTALKECKSQQPDCSAAVCFVDNSYTQRCEFECEVKMDGTAQVFNYNHQSPTVKIDKTTQSPTTKTEDATNLFSTERDFPSNGGTPYIVVAVFFVMLLIIVGVVIGLRNTRKKKQVHYYDEVNLNPPESPTAPETIHDTVDSEDVYYSTVGYTQVKFNAVGSVGTYSTVGAPGMTAADTNPNSLYSLITSPGV